MNRNNPLSKATTCAMAVAVLVLTTAFFASAGVPPTYEIVRSTIDGGGTTTSTGGDFELSGTIGQPDAGVLSGDGFEVSGGFWFGLAPTDCDDDGLVSLFDHDTIVSCLLGPADGIGPSPCGCFDVDGDGHVTLLDYARLQAGFTGP